MSGGFVRADAATYQILTAVDPDQDDPDLLNVLCVYLEAAMRGLRTTSSPTPMRSFSAFEVTIDAPLLYVHCAQRDSYAAMVRAANPRLKPDSHPVCTN